MTENPGSPKNEQSLKALITKGVVGAVSIAGATAIPLLVQKFLTPPATVNQVPTVPAQVTPSQVPTPSAPAGVPAPVVPGAVPVPVPPGGMPVQLDPEGMPVQFQPGLGTPVRVMVRSDDDDDDDDDDRPGRSRKRSKKKD